MRNVGWSLGSFCPFDCNHCYSRVTRTSSHSIRSIDVDRIVRQAKAAHVTGITLGGNEPIYTSGSDTRRTLLPYILDSLATANISSAIISSGPTFASLIRQYPESLDRCSVFAVSLDSPFKSEHDRSRGAQLFDVAMNSISRLRELGKEVCVLYCVTAENCSIRHVVALAELCAKHDVPLRVNTYKHNRIGHDPLRLTDRQYWIWYTALLERFDSMVCSEPALSEALSPRGTGTGRAEAGNRSCPCGTKSFRIGNINSNNAIPVSPCMYRPEFYSSNLLVHDLQDILAGPRFAEFGRAKEQCSGCLGNALVLNDRLTDGYTDSCQFLDARYQPPGPYKIFDAYICTWVGRLRGHAAKS